jgi:hypothetical protein
LVSIASSFCSVAGDSFDIAPPVPVELEEPVLLGAAPELGELVDPEVLAAPVLDDEPLWVLIEDVVLLCVPVAGWLCAYASDAPQMRIAVLVAASARFLIVILSSHRAARTAPVVRLKRAEPRCVARGEEEESDAESP